ncbi:MAG: hypothetical protein FJ304_22080 [Planctomycetes bacterium]|nr:hypothetical protein [Planctomycetota bacterium]
MLRFALVAAAFAAATAFAPSARAAAPTPPDAGKAVTFPFPAKAPVVVQLNGIGAARDRLAAMIKVALPDDAATIEKQLDEGLKKLLAERKLTAVPKDGRVYIAVNDIAALFENTPAVSLLVPVTAYKEFRESFLTADERKTYDAGKNGVDEVKLALFGDDQAVYMVDLKEYVAVTPHKETAEFYATKYARATSAAMAPDLARSFLTADLALYVNLEVINEKYGEQIKAAKGLLDFGFQQAEMGGMLPGVNKRQLSAAKTMLQGVFQGVEDGRGVVLSVEFRPEGLNLRLQAQFADDSTTAALLKAENPGALADLAKLPAGQGQYTGYAIGKKFGQAVRGLTAEFAPADDDEKGNAAIDERLKDLYAAGPLADTAATGTGNLTLTVGKYAEPKKAAAALVGCYQAVSAGGRIQSVVLKDAPKVVADAKTYKDFSFTEVKLAFDFDATVKDLPDALKENTLSQVKRLVAEKMSAWVGTDGKTVIQVSAKDWDAAAGALDRYFEGLKPVGATEGYKLTRKNLPADASILMMLETGSTLTALLDALRAMEGAIPDFPKIGKIKPLEGEPTYIGVAVTLKGDTATANLFVPAKAVAGARKLLDNLFKTIE